MIACAGHNTNYNKIEIVKTLQCQRHTRNNVNDMLETMSMTC